jgi:hypothetical protein
MLDHTEFAKRIDRFLNKAYALDDLSKGCDCINSLFSIYEGWYEFPEEFEGITLKNYARFWIAEHKKARDTLIRFIMGLGRPTEKNFYLRGDLLLFKARDIPVFFSIALGNGNMLMIFKEGPYIVPFSIFGKYFIGTRRLVE